MYFRHSGVIRNQVINTPTLTLPPQGGGDFFLIPICLPSPPQTGERAGVRGKDKKANSYTIQLFQILKNSLDSGFYRSDDFLRKHQYSLVIDHWSLDIDN